MIIDNLFSKQVFVTVFIIILLLFEVNQSLLALQASAAHMRLDPDSEVPKRNSVHYLRQPGVTRKDLHPKKVRD